MFEPQDHPDDIPYPGGPPRPPYDVTGYNISYSMGVKFDRILDGFDGPFERIPDLAPVPKGTVTAAPRGGAYVIDARVNDAFVAVNRLLKAKQPVSRATAPFTVNGKSYPAGSFLVPATAESTPILEKAAADKGLTIEGMQAGPTGEHTPFQVRPLPAGGPPAVPGAARAQRPLGSVRRLDAVGMDALDLRAVRVPVRGRVSPDARRRQPEREVRRARVRRRRHPHARPAGRGRRRRRIRRRPARGRLDPGGVQRLARTRHGREDGAGAEEV